MLYRYEPTWTGLLTAFFEAWKDNSALFSRQAEADAPSLLPAVAVIPNEASADRLWRGMRRLDSALPHTLYNAWCSEWDNIECDMLGTLRLGFSRSQNPLPLHMEPTVHRTAKAANYTGGLAHQYMGILRFVRAGDLYIADMKPECDILAMLGDHFHERFGTNRLIIRDRLRRRALVSTPGDENTPGGWHITALSEHDLAPLPRNGVFETMWKNYFTVIANPARINRKLQQKFVPLKVRGEMTEFL